MDVDHNASFASGEAASSFSLHTDAQGAAMPCVQARKKATTREVDSHPSVLRIDCEQQEPVVTENGLMCIMSAKM